jgi:hypothetical protein
MSERLEETRKAFEEMELADGMLLPAHLARNRNGVYQIFQVKDNWRVWKAALEYAASHTAQESRGEVVTVRAAFALAGHPVPDGVPIYFYDWDGYGDAWHYHLEGTRHYFVPKGNSISGTEPRWVKARGYLDLKRINYANMPAVDCFEHLPKPIQSTLPSTDTLEGEKGD